jgi:integrase/recombinase XerD
MKIDPLKILTRAEIRDVIADLKRKRRSVNTRQNLIVFRLATCAGLRVSEIVGLKMANVKLNSRRPHVEIPAAIAKGRKRRTVPLHWDAATLADLDQWRQERTAQGARPGDPFVCSQAAGRNSRTGEPSLGRPLADRNAQARFKTAIRCLGPERVAILSIHCGRHSFVSHALAGGRTLAEIRDAAGHANVSTTSIYLHTVRDDDETAGSLFEF